MSKLKDLSGRRFGRLVVLDYIGFRRTGAYWRCKCDCGKERAVRSQHLLRGSKSTKSCGCYSRDIAKKRATKHGLSNIPEYQIWKGMKRRCTGQSTKSYKNYGARGIKVCAEWQHDFGAFLEHVGMRPTSRHSMDRIDVNRGYEPGNVRWATSAEQAQNRRKWTTLDKFLDSELLMELRRRGLSST